MIEGVLTASARSHRPSAAPYAKHLRKVHRQRTTRTSNTQTVRNSFEQFAQAISTVERYCYEPKKIFAAAHFEHFHRDRDLGSRTKSVYAENRNHSFGDKDFGSQR